MAIRMVEIDDDTCIASQHVVRLRVGRDERPNAWGVFVTFTTGEVWFRPAENDTQDSARQLMNRWRKTLNGVA